MRSSSCFYLPEIIQQGGDTVHRTALVTGASRGIGRVFARELAAAGYAVTCGARSRDRLEALVRELGSGHRVLAADLSDPGQLRQVVLDVERSAYGLLVNDAGYGMYGRFAELPVEQQENMMTVNMNALMRLSHAFLRNARPDDALINVSSVLSRLPYPGGAVYSGTKAFVTNFTESLWYEQKDRGVYVMALLPGVTRTNFHSIAVGGRTGIEPTGPSYPPEVVVQDALAALRKRKAATTVSGFLYRPLLYLSTRLAGRKMLIRYMGKSSPGMKM
jgi:short-subunit dehydrogenase